MQSRLRKKNFKSKEEIKKLEIEKQSKIDELYALKKENGNLERELKKIVQKNRSLEEKIKELKEKLNEKEKSEEIMKLAVNKDLNALKAVQKLGVAKDLKPQYNTIIIDETKDTIVENKDFELTEPLKKFHNNFEDFYDVIINIKSIKDIIKGWPIKSTEKGKKQYLEKKNEPVLKVGVIGNEDKGKSYLLSRISKIDLPSGVSISTEGLSIKYPELEEYKNRKIALLDSAGLETPVITDKFENNGELFREKSKEKLITEMFLQNYILNVSDILIIVVGKFTYSEQKLLSKIKTEIKMANINKPLFIIHNLLTFTSKEQVENHINDYLLKSATFELEEGHKITTNKVIQNGVYYYEKNTARTIYHLIYANEGSEAG